MFYTYTWVVLKDHQWTPIYVGKGSRARAFDHLKAKTHTGYALRKYPHYVVQTWHDENEDAAFALERQMIARYGRKDLGKGTLFNLTDGGDGVSGPSPETRKKISDKLTGRKATPEHSANMSASLKGKNAGKRRTDEVKAKLKAAAVGRNLGIKRSEETKARMSAAQKRRAAEKRVSS